MKALIQRVKHANVIVDGRSVGAIEQGVLAYIGLGHDDDRKSMQRLVDKILTYRIFENTVDPTKLGKLDQNLQQVGGGLLLVPQFTLMANTNNGRRPDFSAAMVPDAAQALFTEMIVYAQTQYSIVASGEFGANMQIESINDGPLTFLLEV